jgi:hypothetical protein
MTSIKKGWNVEVAKPTKRQSTLPKVNLKKEQFDQLILDQGVNVRVFRTVPCPNVKSIEAGEHEIDCPLCRGSQFVDRYPLETRVVIQSVQTEVAHLVEGLYDGNTVTITLPSGVECQYYTMIELVNYTEIYIERVSRQLGQVDVLKFPATRVNLLIDQHGKEYLEGADFSVDLNSNIKWGTNRGPVEGTIYSIHYETKVRYRTVRALHTNRYGNITENGVDDMTKMAESWLGFKIFLVDRKDQLGNLVRSNKLPLHEISDDSDYYTTT